MLELHIPAAEYFNDATEEFINVPEATLRLEHSLVSLSKWEARWKVPFLTTFGKRNGYTREQLIDYVKCMTINQNVPEEVYIGLGSREFEKVNAYINDEKTATSFFESNARPNRQVVTSELIYYWMTAYQIPWEAQKWHLSRLLTLIRICSIKNSKDQKMSPSAIKAKNKALNAKRRKALGSKG